MTAVVTALRRMEATTGIHRRGRHSCPAIVSYIVTGAGLSGGAGTGLALIGSEVWPEHPRLILGVVLATGIAVDFASSAGRKWLLGIITHLWQAIKARLVEAIRAMIGPGKGDGDE